MIVPLQVGREKSVNALNAASPEGGPIALVTQRQAEQEEIDDPSEALHRGTLAKIAQVVQLQTAPSAPSSRARPSARPWLHLDDPYLRASVEELSDASPDGVEVQALMRTVQAQIEQYVANGAPVPPRRQSRRATSASRDSSRTWWPTAPTCPPSSAQEMLETIDVTDRLKLVSTFLANRSRSSSSRVGSSPNQVGDGQDPA